MLNRKDCSSKESTILKLSYRVFASSVAGYVKLTISASCISPNDKIRTSTLTSTAFTYMKVKTHSKVNEFILKSTTPKHIKSYLNKIFACEYIFLFYPSGLIAGYSHVVLLDIARVGVKQKDNTSLPLSLGKLLA